MKARLVPIRVGMILNSSIVRTSYQPCPHTRGDDPTIAKRAALYCHLSPYAWG